MADKKKDQAQAAPPAKPLATAEQVGQAMQQCKAPSTDGSSERIRNGLIADALNNGANGAEVARAGSGARTTIPENVGKCVADQFKAPGEKAEQTWADKARAAAGGLVNQFTAARDNVVGAIKDDIKVIAPALVNDVTGGVNGQGAVDNIRAGTANSGMTLRK